MKLKNSDVLRESDISANEIVILESAGKCFGRFSELKYGDIARSIEIAEANKNFRYTRQLREELCDIQHMESEISTYEEKWKR